jgi:predicted thioesterase
MWVDLSIKIAAVDGRRVRFEVTGRDAIDEICKGEHTRFVVDTAKTIERLKAKAAKAHAAS